MRRGRDRVRLVGAALALGLGVTFAAAGEPADKPREGGWRWWPSWGKAEPGEKPAGEPVPEATPDAAPVGARQAEREEYHQTVYFRREEVCDRLIEVGLQTGDQELVRQAEELRDRAWAIYLERIGLKKGTFGGEVPEAATPTAARGGE